MSCPLDGLLEPDRPRLPPQLLQTLAAWPHTDCLASLGLSFLICSTRFVTVISLGGCRYSVIDCQLRLRGYFPRFSLCTKLGRLTATPEGRAGSGSGGFSRLQRSGVQAALLGVKSHLLQTALCSFCQTVIERIGSGLLWSQTRGIQVMDSCWNTLLGKTWSLKLKKSALGHQKAEPGCAPRVPCHCIWQEAQS